MRTYDADAYCEVLLFGRDDYFRRGIENAAYVAVRLEPAGVAGVLVGMPAAPLSEGDYIVVLKESTGRVLSVSGICIGGQGTLAPTVQAMLEDQARFAVRTPAPRGRGKKNLLITTAIHDVDPRFVALADSILGQRYDDFNGFCSTRSHRSDTQQVSREVAARDPAFASGASRTICTSSGAVACSSSMRAAPIVPVDRRRAHPDAGDAEQLRGRPPEPDVLYSDEQKITLSGVASEIPGGRPGRTRGAVDARRRI